MSSKYNTSESRYKSATYESPFGSKSFSGSKGFETQYGNTKSPLRSFQHEDRYPKKQDYTQKEYPSRYDEKQQQNSRSFSSYKERKEPSQDYTYSQYSSSFNNMAEDNDSHNYESYLKKSGKTSTDRISQYDERSTGKLEDSFSRYDKRNQSGQDYTSMKNSSSYTDRNMERSGYLKNARLSPPSERNPQNQSITTRQSSFRHDRENSDYRIKDNSYKTEERSQGRLSSPRTSLLQGIKREVVKCDHCKKVKSTTDTEKLICGHTLCKDCNETVKKLETLTKTKNYCPICTELSKKSKAKSESVSRQNQNRDYGFSDETTGVSTIQLQQSVVHCKFHTDEEAKGFCETCDVPVCSPCFKGKKHGKHKIRSLTTTKMNEALVLMERNNKTDTELKPKLQQNLTEVDNQLSVNQQQKERVLLDIDVTADRMVSLIRAKQHAARMEVEESFEVAKKPFVDIKELIENYQSDLEQAVKNTDETLKDNRLVVNSKVISRASNDLDTLEGKIARIPTSADLYDVEFIPGKYEDLNFGNVTAKKSVVWQLHESTHERNVSEARKELQRPLLVSRIQLSVREFTDFNVTPDGDLGILGSWLLSKKNQIRIYDAKTRQEKGNTAEGMRCFILHGDKIHGISEKRSNLVTMTLDGRGKRVTKLNCDPNAIAVDIRGKVYLACSQSFVVYKTSTMEDEYEVAVKCKGFPCKVHITPDGDIITSEYSRQSNEYDNIKPYNFCIRSYSSKGDMLWEYQMTSSKLPPAMVTDHYGNVMITDSDNNRLHKLDKSGKFLGYLLSDSLIIPYSLALVNKNLLYVGQKGQPQIQVFKL